MAGSSIEPNPEVHSRRDDSVFSILGVVVGSPPQLVLRGLDLVGVRDKHHHVNSSCGVLDQQWQLVVVQRPPWLVELDASTGGNRSVVVSNELGAMQVISASIGALAPEEARTRSCVVPEVVSIDGETRRSCPRLRAALCIAVAESPLEVDDATAVPDISMTDIADEVETARSLSMCHAVIDVSYDPTQSVDKLVELLASIVRATPNAISPLGSCDCRG